MASASALRPREGRRGKSGPSFTPDDLALAEGVIAEIGGIPASSFMVSRSRDVIREWIAEGVAAGARRERGD